jgi:hypothetical protein
MTHWSDFLQNLMHVQQVFVRKSYTEFHEHLVGTLVSDSRSQMDSWTDVYT